MLNYAARNGARPNAAPLERLLSQGSCDGLTYGREALRRSASSAEPGGCGGATKIARPGRADRRRHAHRLERRAILAYESGWPPLRSPSTKYRSRLSSSRANCVTGTGGGVRIWVVRDGDRWLMFAGAGAPWPPAGISHRRFCRTRFGRQRGGMARLLAAGARKRDAMEPSRANGVGVTSANRYFRTYCGNRAIRSALPEEIAIDDIARSLAQQCRFSGSHRFPLLDCAALCSR